MLFGAAMFNSVHVAWILVVIVLTYIRVFLI